MKRLIFILYALVLAAGSLQAQVAAPRIAPTINNFYSVVNPATLQWDAPSSVGGGIIQEKGDRTATASGAKLEGYEDKGTVLQGKMIGETFSASLELLNVKSDTNEETGDSSNIKLSSSRIGISVQAMEMLSVGVGSETNKITYTFNSPGLPSASAENKLGISPLIGASFKMADVFFVGIATGKEKFSADALEMERNVLRYGLAYRTGSKGFQSHLEYYVEDRDFVEDAAGFSLEGLKQSALVAEAIFSDIYVGAEIGSAEFSNATEPFSKTDSTTFYVGWLPKEGLAVIASSANIEKTYSTGGTPYADEKGSSTTISAAYQF